MRILILTHAFNSLSQRLYVELDERGHELAVELDISAAVTLEAVRLFCPDVIVAPFLKRAIPEAVWRRIPCLIVHPGPPGDRGPAALDRAILDQRDAWGVTVLQAEAELDAGPVWASRPFAMRKARKSSLYRFEVTEAAVAAVLEALDKFARGQKPRYPQAALLHLSLPVRAEERSIDWRTATTGEILRKIHSADGAPGVRDELGGRACRIFNASPEDRLRGSPGTLLARSAGAVCKATIDGAVWIGRAAAPGACKLPAELILGWRAAGLTAVPANPFRAGPGRTRGDIRYREYGPVGVLEFDFYNGAMSTRACRRLRAAWHTACRRPVRVLVLAGGGDFWSNGLDLNRIEAARSPADESWRNINAMDDLAAAIITTTDRITIAALGGNAAAGGAFLALAADHVWVRDGLVLNPHYKNMGNLYGSEYWTYLLPARVGGNGIAEVMDRRLPLGVKRAHALDLVDAIGPGAPRAFADWWLERAKDLAADPAFDRLLAAKQRRRAADEQRQPLAAYRAAELERIKLNFYGFDPSYHVARHRFVHRAPKAWTPLHLAPHRRLGWRVPEPAARTGSNLETAS